MRPLDFNFDRNLKMLDSDPYIMITVPRNSLPVARYTESMSLKSRASLDVFPVPQARAVPRPEHHGPVVLLQKNPLEVRVREPDHPVPSVGGQAGTVGEPLTRQLFHQPA